MPPKIPPRGVAVRLPKTLKTQKNSPKNSLGLPCLPSAGVGGRGESIVPKGTHRSTLPPPPILRVPGPKISLFFHQTYTYSSGGCLHTMHPPVTWPACLPSRPSSGVGGRGESIVPKDTHRSTPPPYFKGVESKNEQGTKSNTQQSKGHIWCIIIFSFSWVFKVVMCPVSPVGFARFGGLPYVPRGSTYQQLVSTPHLLMPTSQMGVNYMV